MLRTSSTIFFLLFVSLGFTQVQKEFDYLDVFQLEYTADPQISPDGDYVVYRRTGFDIMKDKSKGNLWIAGVKNPKVHHKR